MLLVLWELLARLLWQPSASTPAPATRATRAAFPATIHVAVTQGRLHHGRRLTLAPIHAPWTRPPK